MQEQSHFEVRRAQIIEQLALCRAVELFGRLDLDDNRLLHEQVQSLYPELLTLVEHHDASLAADPVAPVPELTLHRQHIQMLEKPVAERVVYVIESADH